MGGLKQHKKIIKITQFRKDIKIFFVIPQRSHLRKKKKIWPTFFLYFDGFPSRVYFKPALSKYIDVMYNVLKGVLTVLEVFFLWSGPCLAMTYYLKKIKVEVTT